MSNIPDKESFFKNIKTMTDFNHDFFKKVYGYSYCDKDFLKKVANVLAGINRKDVIENYNTWFVDWKAETDIEMKKVSSWYVKELQKIHKDLFKDIPEKRGQKSWITQESLLQKKRQLLLRKKQIIEKSLLK